MIKQIHRVGCSPALASCQKLMQCFALWLCDLQVNAADVTLANLQARMPSPIEADWLWALLKRNVKGAALLSHAQVIAGLSKAEKRGLTAWVQATANIAQHFGPTLAPPFPTQRPNNWASKNGTWTCFKVLFVSFYEIGFKDGLPYQSDGTPTRSKAQKISYSKFVAEFRATHKIDADPDAREVCVLCGGELKDLEVDHWVNKGAVPMLSVCAENLLPICSGCNAGEDVKNQKPVHCDGSFTDWFHPYLRPAYGALNLEYQLPEMAIRCIAVQATNQPKVNSLNELLNLSNRWTSEFKAEHRKKQKEVADRQKRGRGPQNIAELQAWLTEYRDGLVDSEPNYEVHRALAVAMLEPTRLDAWRSEFGLAPSF